MRYLIAKIVLIVMLISLENVEGEEVKKSEFTLPRGVEVSNLSDIHEAYSEQNIDDRYTHFLMNVSAEHIATYFERLIEVIREPGFFLIEAGVTKAEEDQLRKNETDPFHKHVYYGDGMTIEQAKNIFRAYQSLLVNDGMVNFGFGSHNGIDEVFIGPYKLFEIYAEHPGKYREVLKELHVEEQQHVKTVWDTFNQDLPGQLHMIHAEKTIWEMLEELKQMGFYLAETRED